MIEIHYDLTAPWWVVPLFIGGLTLMVLVIYGAAALFDRWSNR